MSKPSQTWLNGIYRNDDNWYFIFLVVSGRLQEELVLQLRQAQERLLNSACLGPLSEAPEEEEEEVLFTVKYEENTYM